MKFISILLTILAFIGLVTIILGIFKFKENHLILLGMFISGLATITNWFVHKKHLSENKMDEK